MAKEYSPADQQQHEFRGPERRRVIKRRVRLDQRSIIRFDAMGGDRRAGFARRNTDEGLRDDDLE